MQLNAKSGLITLLLTGVASLLVVIVIYMTLVRPCRAEVASIANEVASREAQQTDASRASREETKKALHAKCVSAMADLGKYVIHPDDRMDVAMAIGDLASGAGITEFSDTYRPPVPGSGNISSYVIEVKCKATYPQLARFIQALESNTPVIFVDTFSISRATNKEIQNDVSMTLTVLVRPEDDLGKSLDMYVPKEGMTDTPNRDIVMEDAHGG